ncbi:MULTISPECIES: ImmA/IrrE family metallo-endopeptidase [unclassified Virgibacillus]|uniref:ImmA/IrrE family metallo-endopeptidase n=1 Tax=unclassified Virgibacillus TaxID=2620237 RepID=UPI000418B774|nr:MULTISPECIES: ImmA/IrrE family metallo-endopeptidase [Bacillaceae]MDY7046704.1 ImmA/IrrE family metallo-endopeptidase [Virgibacillus sp. M23]
MSRKNKLSPKKKKELYQTVVPIAEEFRNRFLNKDGPIEDTFDTLEQLGYFIVRFPAHNNLSGFYIKKGEYNCIFVNSSHSLGRQYYSAWHEVYHAYTGDIGGISLFDEIQHSEMEQRAEYFASCILMPEDLIRKYIRQKGLSHLKYVSYNDLIIMQNYFRVSFSALITRLIKLYPSYQKELSNRYNLGLIKNAQKLLNKIHAVGGDEALVLPTNKFSVSQRFYELLYSNLENDRITADKAQSILELLESMRQKYES